MDINFISNTLLRDYNITAFNADYLFRSSVVLLLRYAFSFRMFIGSTGCVFILGRGADNSILTHYVVVVVVVEMI